MALSIDDERLRLGLRRGDENALAEVIRVWRIVDGKLSRGEAEEILSEVFYSLWTHADAIDSGKLKAYLASIARSKALDALRRAGREEPLEEDELLRLSVPGPEEEAERRSEAAVVRKAVDDLGEPDRTIFLRHYWLREKTADVARAMGMNVNTVQSRLRRGREALRRSLTEGGYFIG